MNSYKAGTKFK